MDMFPVKDPAEIRTLGFNFKKDCPTGAKPSGCVFKAYLDGEAVEGVLDTADPDVTLWPKARIRAIGGESGQTYVIEATVTLDNGEVLVGVGKLPVSYKR